MVAGLVGFYYTSLMKRAYFFWDYNLSEADVKRLLKEGDEHTRLWIIARILQYATYEDIWKYITLKELNQVYSRLKLRPQLKKVWDYALSIWNDHEKPAY